MTYILSSLVVLAQSIIGLMYLIIVLFVAFAVAEFLGFVAPAPGAEPNERWLKRKAKREGRKTDLQKFIERLQEPMHRVETDRGVWLSMREKDFEEIAKAFGVPPEYWTDRPGGRT
jgi:hypothetical protein